MFFNSACLWLLWFCVGHSVKLKKKKQEAKQSSRIITSHGYETRSSDSFSGIKKKSGIIWLREGIDGFAFFRNQPVPNITVNSLKRKTTNSREKSLPWDKIVRTFNRLLSEVICRQPVTSGRRDLEQSSILYPGFQRLFFFVSTVYFILSIWRTLLWSQSKYSTANVTMISTSFECGLTKV